MIPMIPFRLGLQQRVFPAYRAPFFDALARACVGGLSVFSGDPQFDEALGDMGRLSVAQHIRARNVYMGGGPFLLYLQRGVIDWLERWQPDVLVMEANPRNLSNNAAATWMHSHGGKVIGWALGAPPARGVLAPLMEASRRRFLSQFDALISYSQSGADQFQAAGVPAERIYIAPNAVTPRPTQPPPDRPDTFRDGRPVVLFVGRLQARKRVDRLLRACAALPAPLQPRLVIVGDGPARADFEAAARAVYQSAEFAGEQHGPALDPYYAAADLFVLPGTGGLAVQQAMSHALPVMVAEADGTQSNLVRPDNGWLLPPGDDDALVRRLAEALEDAARLRRMGMESYHIVAEEVNLERMVEVFAEAIRNITAKDAKGRK